MRLTAEPVLRACATTVNLVDGPSLEPLLVDDFPYTSELGIPSNRFERYLPGVHLARTAVLRKSDEAT